MLGRGLGRIEGFNLISLLEAGPARGNEDLVACLWNLTIFERGREAISFSRPRACASCLGGEHIGTGRPTRPTPSGACGRRECLPLRSLLANPVDNDGGKPRLPWRGVGVSGLLRGSGHEYHAGPIRSAEVENYNHEFDPPAAGSKLPYGGLGRSAAQDPEAGAFSIG